MGIPGHVWTVLPHFAGMLRSLLPMAKAEPWSGPVLSSDVGDVPVTGTRYRCEGARDLLLILHGLGGEPDSVYCLRAVRAALAAGLDVIVVAARGADRGGFDVGHGGLTEDLRVVLASEEAQGYRRRFVLGYSLGGHLALRHAVEEGACADAVVAVCPPVDLRAACVAVDAPRQSFYRTRMLRGLHDIYAALETRARAWTSVDVVRATRSIRAYDEAVIVPRYGFADADDYYDRAMVAPHLHALRVPTLVVVGGDDPLIPVESAVPHFEAACSPHLSWKIVRHGGHVGFPPAVDLGLGVRGNVEVQAVAWLTRQG